MAEPRKALVTETDLEIKRAVTIEPLSIQEEYVKLPGLLNRWIQERVALVKLVRLAELELEEVEAGVKVRLRRENRDAIEAAEAEAEAAAAGGAKVKPAKVKPITEDAVAAQVTLSEEYRAARRQLIDAQERRDRASGMVEALHAKREMLVSLGADLRSEKEGDPSIRDRPRGR